MQFATHAYQTKSTRLGNYRRRNRRASFSWARAVRVTYEPCFVHELAKRGLTFARQVPVPLVYDGIVLDCVYRADVLVKYSPEQMRQLKKMNEISDTFMSKTGVADTAAEQEDNTFVFEDI